MKIEVTRVTDWQRVVDAARLTAHKAPLGHEPSEEFKRTMLRAEHSPIRLLEFDIRIYGVPYFVVMHLVRHNQGIEKFVATSREDKTGVPRDDRKQTDLVDCQFSVNAQALINISRKRLCCRADKKTREVWLDVVHKVSEVDKEVGHSCVPECIYRGFCPEGDKSCGMSKTDTWTYFVEGYRNGE